MTPAVFLDHYRISGAKDERPVEIARNGPAVTYRAADLKSGAPVALTLIPMASVDPAERDRFEQNARTAMLLDHVNISKTVAFGTFEDSFVFVSEYPQGETVDDWVRANGPMPADAVLRVALQVVAALGAASFHGLTHPAIQPANLVIVAGTTAEGGWPFVKLSHFALSGLKSAPRHAEPDLSASDFASPEQLLQGKIDFRSEIYSLGATMCFLLTGVFYSAYPRSPQTKRFARPLRTLIARTLEDDPADRPQDPVLFTEELRSCLAAIERREAMHGRFGIPFSPAVAKLRRKRQVRQARPTPLLAAIGPTAPDAELVTRPSRWRPAWAFAGCLLVLGVIAALFLPEDIVTAAFHRKKPKPIDSIGVPVGVPESAPAAIVQTNAAQPAPSVQNSNASSSAIATAPRAGENAAVPVTEVAKNAPNPPPAAPQSPPATPAAAVAQQRTAPGDHSAPVSTPPRSSTETGDRTSQTSVVSIASNAPVSQPEKTSPDIDRTAAPASTATPATLAANNVSPEPAPPSESPNANVGAQSDGTNEKHENDGNVEGAAAARPATDTPARSEKARAGATTTSRTKKSATVTQRREHLRATRVPRALPAEAEPDPRSGTMRARVVGITPAGNVILELPSGEQAIVSPQDAEQYSRTQAPHRRSRRVIIERRTILVPPYPPYQPFIPPDA